ncbi:DUF2950 domain-containing protein [Geotalea sp. SG265]|uniref:DUF2950 domain-containing protein n=1 Tax=Geotalea sp. SG265 TaxID=2922867 RepID=UPI001FAF793A|nr:DUF2950 domain-containing protein [Geotalea sp. SG265]
MHRFIYSALRPALLMLSIMASVLFPLHLDAVENDMPQRSFSSPEEARDQLLKAVVSKDLPELEKIFGPAYGDLDPGDPVQRAAELRHLSQHLKEGVVLVQEGESRAMLQIGKEKWPFPVPIVRQGSGWFFDTKAGRDEILNRRIGRDELLAINACLAYVAAQREYYDLSEPEGVQIPKYAQRLISSPDKHDGLYWPTMPGSKESPLGSFITKAKEKGYVPEQAPRGKGPILFSGYYFRILKRQGPSAPGGKFSYIINGNMVAGHALIAYPAKWGVSGVMTFIVNQRGRVYQKNLGPATARIAKEIKAYNPDLTWKVVEEQ